MRYFAQFLLFVCVLSPSGWAETREWSCPAGKFKVTGEAIAFSDDMVVLKKKSGELIALELEQLCDADKKFVAEQQKEEGKQEKKPEEMHTWTTKDGLKVRGQVVSYGQKELVIERKRGKVVVDGDSFEDIDSLHQGVLLRILSRLEKTKLSDQKSLEEWARKKVKGTPKKFELSGVLMRLESGDMVGMPFFMFDPKELEILKPGWELWLEKKESEEARKREDFLMRTQAMAYQRDRAISQKIEMVKLDLLGATAGVVDIWQVSLVPRPGVRARPFSVMVTADNNVIAQQIAQKNYPKFVVGGTRRASR
ncbi:MAG: SHD1 domain-containing protein [Planctomycetota bacterium]|nr:SHD1 domain-containing protein [Planctomycetota bacterium]